MVTGYSGIFGISVLGIATIFFVLPIDAIILISDGYLHAVLVCIIACIDTAIGELSAYYVGRAGRKIVDLKIKKKKGFSKVERMFRKCGFWTILIFSFTPLPMDVIGLVCRGTKYNAKKSL